MATTVTLNAFHRGSWLGPVVATAAFGVYVATLAPGLTFEHGGTDAGDLIAAARSLGVPHPTGYPTYTLLAWLAIHLPIGTVAYRTNLLSAACAAAAAGLLCSTARRLLADTGQPFLLAAGSGLTLAFSSLLWSQAVITEVYTLLMLFAALVMWLLIRWRQGGADRLLLLSALVLGLGLGNHLTLVFVVPAALVALWPERGRWLQAPILASCIALLLVGMSIYVYLPLAAACSPAVNWGDPQTWDRFLWVVTARQYQPFVFGLEPADIPARLAMWAWYLGDQFGWWGLAIAATGTWSWWQKDRALALAGLVWALLGGTYGFFYYPSDSHFYLLPLLLPLALAWGRGVADLLEMARDLRPGWQHLALAAAMLLPVSSLTLHWGRADLSDDWTGYAYVHQVLAAAAPDSLIIVRGDAPTFALWYGLYAEGRRSDVAVVSGPLLAYPWYRGHIRHHYPGLGLTEPSEAGVATDSLVRELVLSNLPHRPVYATDPAEEWQTWAHFVQVQNWPLFQARSLATPSNGTNFQLQSRLTTQDPYR